MYELHDYQVGEQSRIDEARRRRQRHASYRRTPADRLTEAVSLGGLGGLLLVCVLLGARVDPGLGWAAVLVLAGAALGFFASLASLANGARRRRLERQVLARPLHRRTRSRTR